MFVSTKCYMIIRNNDGLSLGLKIVICYQKQWKRSKYHAYEIQMLHQSTRDEPDRGKEFCESMKKNISNIAPIPKFVLMISSQTKLSLLTSSEKLVLNCTEWLSYSIIKELHRITPVKLGTT